MTYSTIQYQDIIIWYDCADVIVQVKSRAGYILCIYTIYLFTTLLCIYLFYIQYFEIVPLTPDFMSDPRFVSFIVYVDNSRVLSTSSPESGVEVMHSRSRLWSTEPTCRCVYISAVYFIHMTDLYIQYGMYIEILFSTHYVLTLYHLLPQLYLILYIIYLFCSCISWLLYFIPAMWDCCR